MTTTIHGKCLCGAVQFEYDAPSKWCAHCHCSMCRRAHGAAFVTWVGVPSSSFRLTAGADVLKSYKSSPPAKRSFCGACGSPLLFESTRWPDEVHIAVASLVDPVDKQPNAHVFFSDKAPWIVVADELKKRGGATGTEVLPEAT